jgi:hypothetical protein
MKASMQATNFCRINIRLIATILLFAVLYHQSLEASDTFSGLARGSLGYSLATNLFARTNFSPSAKADFMFGTKDYSTIHFVRNPDFWLGLPPQLTAIVIGAGAGTNTGTRSYLASDGTTNQYIGGAAISPVHVVNCRHAPFVAGNVLLFVDRKGRPVLRTVVGNVDCGGDINVSLLNRPLPSTIHPFALLPPDMTNYLPGAENSYVYSFVAQNQRQQIYPVKIGWFGDAKVNYWIFTCLPDTSHFPTNWGYMPVAGDSGHPIMALVGTNLLLAGHWTSPASGPLYNAYYSNINLAMHWLSTNYSIGSDYHLATGDLSGFTYYEQ